MKIIKLIKNRRPIALLLTLFFLAQSFAACKGDNNDNSGLALLLASAFSNQTKASELSINGKMTAFFNKTVSSKNVVAATAEETNSIERSNSASTAGNGSVSGTLTATDTTTLVETVFTWYGTVDESTFTLTSTKTIALDPGTYNFVMSLEDNSYKYTGVVSDVVIADGENTIDLTMMPVIGDTSITISTTNIAALLLSYNSTEITESGLTSPSVGVIVDGSTEQLFTLDTSTGQGDGYLYVTTGDHNISLKLYESANQVGKSLPSQEDITVVATQNITMDLTSLYGETSFNLTTSGGTATFNFTIPSDVVHEVGTITNLESVLQMTGSVNGYLETPLTFTASGSNYVASTTFSNFRYDTLAISVVFKDIADDYTVGTCNISSAALTKSSLTLNCDMDLYRRALISGSLLAVTGINVYNQDNDAVVGASIYVDGDFKGLTGSGTFGTAGYYKLLTASGTYTLKATYSGEYGEVSLTAAALGIYNKDIILGEPLEIQSFSLLQSIHTIRAGDIHFFTMGNEEYVAVANHYNGSSFSINSEIYKKNGDTFDLFQSIPTTGARSWEYFEIGSESYLVVANYQNDSGYSTDSIVYHFDGTSFVQFYTIPTSGGHDIEPFVMNGVQYLAVANRTDGYIGTINSQIYVWNGTTFELFQSIGTNGALSWKYFEMEGSSYLLASNGLGDSILYKFNISSFEFFQTLSLLSDYSWDFKQIGTDYFLAAAVGNTTVFKWNGSSFLEYQTITMDGAADVQFFSRGTHTYLAVAARGNETTVQVNSKILEWNGSSFVDFLSIPSNGALAIDYTEIDNIPYFAIANEKTDTGESDSWLFRAILQ